MILHPPPLQPSRPTAASLLYRIGMDERRYSESDYRSAVSELHGTTSSEGHCVEKITLNPLGPKFVPGAVIKGVTNATGLSGQLLRTMQDSSRCCAVAIANHSGFCLTHPHRFMRSGRVLGMPPSIDHGYTGLIGTQKSPYSLRGCAGVLTYDLKPDSMYHLQVLWSIPYDLNFFDIWMNVNIGKDVASPELYRQLYTGQLGEITRAKDTSRVFQLADGLIAVVLMSEGPRCILSMKLYDKSTPTFSFRNNAFP